MHKQFYIASEVTLLVSTNYYFYRKLFTLFILFLLMNSLHDMENADEKELEDSKLAGKHVCTSSE